MMNARGEEVPSSKILGVDLIELNKSPLEYFSVPLHWVNQDFYTI